MTIPFCSSAPRMHRSARSLGWPGLHHFSFEASSIEEVGQYEERLAEEGVRLLHDGIVSHGESADSGGIFLEDPNGIRLAIYSPTGVGGNEAPHEKEITEMVKYRTVDVEGIDVFYREAGDPANPAPRRSRDERRRSTRASNAARRE